MSIKQKAQETKAKIKDFYHRHESTIQAAALFAISVGWGVVGYYVGEERGKALEEDRQLLTNIEGAKQNKFSMRRNRITNEALVYAPHLFQRDSADETIGLDTFSTESSSVDAEDMQRALLKTMSDLHCWPVNEGELRGNIERIDIWTRYKED